MHSAREWHPACSVRISPPSAPQSFVNGSFLVFVFPKTYPVAIGLNPDGEGMRNGVFRHDPEKKTGCMVAALN